MGRRGGEGTEFTVKYAGTALDKVGFTFFPFFGGGGSPNLFRAGPLSSIDPYEYLL